MDNDLLLSEDRGAVRILTVNRPTKLNALNAGVLAALDVAFQEIAGSDSVRAVVITGAGEKAFVAGADIQELAELNATTGKGQVQHGQAVLARIDMLNKPVIGAVNGYALGGGLELALACHLRVAAPNAKLGLPEVKLGIIPGYGGTQRLQRIIGAARALELILTGEPIGAEKALEWGLVNRVAPSAKETVDEALALLDPILKRGPLAVGAAIEATRRGRNLALGEALRVEADLFGLLASTHDMHEGMRAFLEKRNPEFEGR